MCSGILRIQTVNKNDKQNHKAGQSLCPIGQVVEKSMKAGKNQLATEVAIVCSIDQIGPVFVPLI